MEDFAAKEFKAICENVQRRKRYGLELVLRVANFKSQAPLYYEPNKEENWQSVVERINEVIEDADKQEDTCIPLERLCRIPGIGVPRASALLAAWNPRRFAIIDMKMFKFFQQEDAYRIVVEEFEIPGDSGLRGDIDKLKKEFDQISNSSWDMIYRKKIYPNYLKVLRTICDRTREQDNESVDLRDVEWRIWQRSKSHTND